MEGGEVFECRVTSKAFRGKDKCHSRPISVMPNPGFVKPHKGHHIGTTASDNTSPSSTCPPL